MGGGGVVVGQQPQCPLALGPVEAGGRKGLTADGAGQDPSDIRVQHEGAPTVGEGQDRTGRVLPHPGQGQEGVQVIGQDAAVLLDDAAGALDEPQGPAWVAQATPDPQHRSGGGLGELGGAGPAPHPLLPGRDDASHRGLLAHDLRDENLPRRRTGPAPRQVAGMGVVPGHDILRRGRSSERVVRGGAGGHGDTVAATAWARPDAFVTSRLRSGSLLAVVG